MAPTPSDAVVLRAALPASTLAAALGPVALLALVTVGLVLVVLVAGLLSERRFAATLKRLASESTAAVRPPLRPAA